MSPQGTAAYDGLTDLPPLVERAVDLARRLGFASSGRPEYGGYPPDPEELLKPGGTVVIDDLTPPRPGRRASAGRSTRPGYTGSPTPPWTPPSSGLPPTWPPSPPPAASLLANGAS
jgi:hypothetical protein